MTKSYTIPRNFRRVVRRIQGHRTYTLCQLSYDVGQRASIGSQNRAWNRPHIFILYAEWKTALRRPEPGSANPPIPREKLYENRSYVRACPRSRAGDAVARPSRDRAEPRHDLGVLDRGRSPSPLAPSSGVRKRARTRDAGRRQSPWRERSACGRSKPSGNLHGSASTYTSHARTPAGRNGIPPCRIRI